MVQREFNSEKGILFLKPLGPLEYAYVFRISVMGTSLKFGNFSSECIQ